MVGDKRKFNVVLVTLKAVGATGERPGHVIIFTSRRVPVLTRVVSGGNDLEKAAIEHCSSGVNTISQVALCVCVCVFVCVFVCVCVSVCLTSPLRLWTILFSSNPSRLQSRPPTKTAKFAPATPPGKFFKLFARNADDDVWLLSHCLYFLKCNAQNQNRILV
jgi:hypothetical protein